MVPVKLTEDRTIPFLWVIIHQSCLKISTVHVICKMDFELAWEQPSSPSILFLLSVKCCPFSLPNYKPSKNCHWWIAAAHLLQDQRWPVQCPCKPDAIPSLSQDATCDCCYWLDQALQQRSVQAPCLSVLSAVSQGSKKNKCFKKYIKNWK